MANFKSGAAARGLSRGLAIREARKSREADEESERAEKFKVANDEARDSAIENVTQFSQFAVQAAEKGASSEQLEEFRNGATSAAMTYGQALEQYRKQAEQVGEDPGQIPSGTEFVEQQLALFDAAVSSASVEDTSDDFETLSPEETAEMGFPEGAVVQRGPDNQVKLTFDPSTSLSAFQEKVDALTPFVGEEKAVGIAAGRFAVSVNPISGERVVIDIATGEPVGEVKQPPPESNVPAIIPEDIATDVATGLPGALKNAANIIKDAVGAGAAFPDAQAATEALSSIQVLTTITLQAEVPGRPSKFLLEKLEGLTIKPNSIFQGEARAKTRLEQTRRILDGEIQRMEQEVLPLELLPETRVETQLNLSQMKRLRDAYDDLLTGFDSDEEEVDEELEGLLDKHAPAEEK